MDWFFGKNQKIVKYQINVSQSFMFECLCDFFPRDKTKSRPAFVSTSTDAIFKHLQQHFLELYAFRTFKYWEQRLDKEKIRQISENDLYFIPGGRKETYPPIRVDAWVATGQQQHPWYYLQVQYLDLEWFIQETRFASDMSDDLTPPRPKIPSNGVQKRF